jgi:hypothetical protein
MAVTSLILAIGALSVLVAIVLASPPTVPR